jgi:hypothetical protein
MKTFTVLVIAMIGLNLGVNAQTAASWNFTGNSVAPHSTGANITASSVAMGANITGGPNFSGTDFFGQDGWPTTATIDGNAYMQVVIGPNSGYYLVLNTFSVNLRHSTLGPAAGSGPTSYLIASSLDNYASALASGTLTTSYQTINITLPAAFQGLTGSVTFRIYGYNASLPSGGSNRLVTNGISLTGHSVAGTLAARSIDLTAAARGQGVGLQWQTAGFDEGTALFLERATDGVHFNTIGEVTGVSAADNDVMPGQLYYRLEARSTDGSSYYSPIVTVTVNAAGGTSSPIRGIAAQGNDVRTFLHLPISGTYQLSIRTMGGQVLYRAETSAPTGDVTTDIAFGSMPHGAYVLTLAGNGTNSSKVFLH